MGSTYTQLTYHVVFSTKYRRPTINSTWKKELYSYIGGIVRNQDGVLLEVGGIADHVHLLLVISAKQAVAEMIRFVKTNSSKWVNEKYASGCFQWQTGYSAFTVSHSQVEAVRRYIQNQEEHHRKLSFTEEFTRFLQRHEIAFDSRDVFEIDNARNPGADAPG